MLNAIDPENQIESRARDRGKPDDTNPACQGPTITLVQRGRGGLALLRSLADSVPRRSRNVSFPHLRLKCIDSLMQVLDVATQIVNRRDRDEAQWNPHAPEH